MYIKKILVAVALIGLLIFGYFAYFVYNAMFSPNTAFNNREAFVYITSDATYEDVRTQLQPLLKNMRLLCFLSRVENPPKERDRPWDENPDFFMCGKFIFKRQV